MSTASVQDPITRRARSCEARSRYWAQVLREANSTAPSRIPLPAGIPSEVTAVLNRDRFYEAVHRELSRGERCASTTTLVLCHLEQMSEDMSTDAFHQALAPACLYCLRGYDYAGRLAENTIGLLLPESDRHGAQTAILRITTIIMSQLSACHPAQRWSLRVGLACFPFEAEDSVGLFHTASDTQFLLQASVDELTMTT
ncbi:MAG: diguanylate cyclase [Nitrospirales bacterium]